MLQFELNELQQPVGMPVEIRKLPDFPVPENFAGKYCRLEPLDATKHAEGLFQSNALDKEGRNWTYLPYGPFANIQDYCDWVLQASRSVDPQYYAIIDQVSGQAVGVAAYLRMDPKSGSIEVGGLNFSPLPQRTPAATEAMYLMMQRAFALGYRRYEWKCNALNDPSRKAAQRLGFSYEGVFRQALIVKGRNRDTAWYAVIDTEWPQLQHAFEQWMSPDNFDDSGKQRVSLSSLTAPVLKQRG